MRFPDFFAELDINVLWAVFLGVFDVGVQRCADALANGGVVAEEFDILMDVAAPIKREKALGAVRATCMPRYCSTGARGVASKC